jgi:hypothetical protein
VINEKAFYLDRRDNWIVALVYLKVKVIEAISWNSSIVINAYL